MKAPNKLSRRLHEIKMCNTKRGREDTNKQNSATSKKKE